MTHYRGLYKVYKTWYCKYTVLIPYTNWYVIEMNFFKEKKINKSLLKTKKKLLTRFLNQVYQA